MVISFTASASGAGKTTLIERLIPLLDKRGFRVGAVKHSRHRAEVDREGTDSWRFARAGSIVTVLAAPGTLAVIRSSDEPALEDALAEASRGTEIVLVEGFRGAAVPRIEVHRSGVSRDLPGRGSGGLSGSIVAVASDTATDLDVPVLDLNDPASVCDWIVERYLSKR